MIRRIGTPLAFLSAIFFPWPLTVCIALGVALFEPLLPLAVGLFVDVLYFVPHGFSLPLFTLGGALVTVAALLVRSRLQAGIIG